MNGRKTEARKEFEDAIEFATKSKIPSRVMAIQKYLLNC
jgi:hypothetical protein